MNVAEKIETIELACAKHAQNGGKFRTNVLVSASGSRCALGTVSENYDELDEMFGADFVNGVMVGFDEAENYSSADACYRALARPRAAVRLGYRMAKKYLGA